MVSKIRDYIAYVKSNGGNRAVLVLAQVLRVGSFGTVAA
jgi:hypothetical protein